jgi:hypothetical protein
MRDCESPSRFECWIVSELTALLPLGTWRHGAMCCIAESDATAAGYPRFGDFRDLRARLDLAGEFANVAPDALWGSGACLRGRPASGRCGGGRE